MQCVGVAIPRSGQEDGLAIRHADYPDSHHVVQRGPFPRAIVNQLRPFVNGRCTPATAPEHVGNVVGRLEGNLSVGIAEGRVCKVFRKSLAFVLTPLVIIPSIESFRFRFAPGIAVAIVFRCRGANVHRRPKGTRRQTEVDVWMAMQLLVKGVLICVVMVSILGV